MIDLKTSSQHFEDIQMLTLACRYTRGAVDFGGTKSLWAPQTYFNYQIDILFPVANRDWDNLHTALGNMSVVEIITKARNLRQFRRIAMSLETDADDWDANGYFLSQPRSKIEEIIVTWARDDVLEHDQRLVPLAEDDLIPSGMESNQNVTVASNRQQISKILASVDLDAYPGGDIAEDAKGPDEPSEEIPATVGKSSQPRKPPPSLRFMALRMHLPARQPRIYLG